MFGSVVTVTRLIYARKCLKPRIIRIQMAENNEISVPPLIIII